MSKPRPLMAAIILFGAVGALLGGCQLDAAPAPDNGPAIRTGDVDSVVGRCSSLGSSGSGAARPGMALCDLVRTQGRPKDAVVAELPDGRERVELFYPGNGGTTRGYTFIADRLVSTPPGTLKE